MLVDQPSLEPTRKVTFAGLSTVLSIIIVWLWTTFVPDKPMPAEVGAAMGGIMAFICSWIVKERGTSRGVLPS